MGFFTGLAFWGKSLLKGIAWPAKRLRGEHKVGPLLRWTLHFLVLAAVLVALGFLNQWCGLDRMLRAPWPLLRAIWLPLVCLSFYLACWFAWWLTRLLRTGLDCSEWPDLDAAWSQAVEAVERAGIDPRTLPVYLLLGRPAGDVRSLLAAAEVPLSVPQTPRDSAAPVHVFANREAIYVSCANTSLLGAQASLLAQSAAELAASSPADATPDGVEDQHDFWNKDVAPGGTDAATANATDSLQTAVAMLVEEETAPQPSAAATPAVAPQSLLEQADVIERTTSRLQHLCTLIARDRQPYCPINGLLVLLPFAASEDELTAGQTAALLERDLSTIHRTLDVRCGVITLICDLQETAGGRELLARFPESQRRRRLGISFPLLSQCDSEQTPSMLERGVTWICGNLMPPLVYRLAPIRKGDQRADQDQLRANAQLYRLVSQFRQRQSRLIRLLHRAFCPDHDSPWLMTGCYLVASGEDAVHDQGFTGGIFPQLVQIQNHVAWTREALDDDRFCRRLTWAGYLAMAACLIGIAAVIIAA